MSLFKKEERRRSKTLSSHKNDVQTVAVGVSELDYIGLTLVDSRVTINEICYCGLLPPQQLLLCQVSSEFRNSAPVYRSR